MVEYHSARSGDPVIGRSVDRDAEIYEPYANRDQIAEAYANLGWLGMTASQPYANLG